MRRALLSLLLLALVVHPPAATARGTARGTVGSPVLRACARSVMAIAESLEYDAHDEEARLARLRAWAGQRPLGACQVAYLLPVFHFSDPMLRALAILAPHVVDRENVELIVSMFPAEEDRARARQILRP